MKDALVSYSERLYIAEKDLERDMVSALSNKCGSWQSGNRSDLGELLQWFDLHEEQYPMFDFGSTGSGENDLHQWDTPWSAARVAQLRYLMFSTLQDPERAKAAKLLAENAANFVPFDRLSEMSLLNKYLLEWFNPVSGEAVTPFEVLGRRIWNHYPEASTNDGSDWYRYLGLEPSELQNVILCFPFDQKRFLDKIESLRQWFSEDTSLDGRSSDYLIARLYLEHYSHAKLKAQNQKVKDEIVSDFSDFVNNMHQSSLEVRRQLQASDRAMLAANAESRKRFEDWRAALEEFSLSMQDQTWQASKLIQLQRSLKAEEQHMSEDPVCAKFIAFSKGDPPSMAEVGALFAGTGSKKRVILVDWFTADVPVATDKLFMVTVEVALDLQRPVILELELGIARKVLDWIQKYIQGDNAAQNRRNRASNDEPNSLAGLVQPLAAVSKPNDILVFCPTTKWYLHQIPLHDIQLRTDAASEDIEESKRDNLLLLRNRIVYTYSQSLLRLSVVTRQSEDSPEVAWSATLLSPLSSAVDAREKDSSPSRESLETSRRMTDLASFFATSGDRTSLLASTSVNKAASVQTRLDSSFLAFLGHVHTAPRAVKSQMVLHHLHPLAECEAFSETAPKPFLSGEDVISRTRLQTGAHVVLLACGSGVTKARVQDEVLGLVLAFFHAGARSVVATMWAVRIETACAWLQAVQNCWESQELKLRRQDKVNRATSWNRMVNLAKIFNSTAKIVMASGESAGIDSWAPFMYSGYWMYPRVHVDVFDSDDEQE